MAERTGLEPATPGVTGRPSFNREQPTELLSPDDRILRVQNCPEQFCTTPSVGPTE